MLLSWFKRLKEKEREMRKLTVLVTIILVVGLIVGYCIANEPGTAAEDTKKKGIFSFGINFGEPVKDIDLGAITFVVEETRVITAYYKGVKISSITTHSNYNSSLSNTSSRMVNDEGELFGTMEIRVEKVEY